MNDQQSCARELIFPIFLHQILVGYKNMFGAEQWEQALTTLPPQTRKVLAERYGMWRLTSWIVFSLDGYFSWSLLSWRPSYILQTLNVSSSIRLNNNWYDFSTTKKCRLPLLNYFIWIFLSASQWCLWKGAKWLWHLDGGPVWRHWCAANETFVRS